MDVELYSWQFCPFAQRTRIALEVKSVDYQLHEIDITKPYPEGFLRHNPNGQVPTLIYKGQAIYESDVLGEFIDETFSGPQLLPESSYERALARLLTSICDNRFIPVIYQLLLNQEPALDDELETKIFASISQIDQFLDTHSSSKEYFFDLPSLCEYAIGPFFQRLDVALYYRNVQIPDGKKFQHFHRWRKACLELLPIVETAPNTETLIKLYADYARGVTNGKRPDNAEFSSFDVKAQPIEARELPKPGLRCQLSV